MKKISICRQSGVIIVFSCLCTIMCTYSECFHHIVIMQKSKCQYTTYFSFIYSRFVKTGDKTTTTHYNRHCRSPVSPASSSCCCWICCCRVKRMVQLCCHIWLNCWRTICIAYANVCIAIVCVCA